MKNIKIIGAKENNLKNINLKIPRNKLVVFTGVSGSGKSSLVFNTIYKESQRQFLESLSAYSRYRLPKFNRPNVSEIKGISPVIILDQKRLGRNPRSTVGTVTEIYTYLRLLFSRCGKPHLGDSTLFSFNTPEGMCPSCKGLGEELILDKDRLLDWKKSLEEGAIKPSEYKVKGRRWTILKGTGFFDMKKPLKEFTDEEIDKLLFSERVIVNKSEDKNILEKFSFEGIITGIKRRRLDKRGTRSGEIKYFNFIPCTACNGFRLNKRASSVKINGKTLPELVSMELTDLKAFMKTVSGPVEGPIVEKVIDSLSHLIEIGVGYISLNQSIRTLSGGESQRVKMARQVGTNLVELLYILDEPSIGLHPRDISHLNLMLKKLRNHGNSVLVVEHDPSVMKTADHIIDMGPGAGAQGGKIVFQGSFKDLKKSDSLTAEYLNKSLHKKKTHYRQPKETIPIKNATLHNLKDVSVNIPTKVFVCITGVAGSGKSTLINDIFVKENPGSIVVDQSPIGISTRSNPATYVGVFDLIRKEFAKQTGKQASLFSFNSKGACPKCNGLGYKRIEMHFLDNVTVLCDVCEGKRYTQEVLNEKYKGKNIAEVLKMTVRQAMRFFDNEKIKEKLKILEDVGLMYLELGQPLDTLSGGEAQRIKLASELHKKGNIYVLDEPTTGLHMADIKRLVDLLNKFVDNGNTVIVIEHNLDIISQADWIIDLGPEGGSKGGAIIVEGTIDNLIQTKKSYTGQYLKNLKIK